MKSFLILIFMACALDVFGQGDAPPFAQGQGQATKSVTSILEVPNNQLTKTSGSKALVETGNNNLLSNPSFEHSTYNTGWTSLSGTSVVETSVVVHGKKSHKITYSSAFVSLTPSDVTTNAGQFADLSVQGVASVRVKAPFSVKICVRNAGVTSTTLCSSPTQGLNKWEQIYYPFVLGATSNGFEIKSDALVTGVAYFDDAYMGPDKVTASTSVVGPWTTGTCTSTWTTNTATTCKYRQVGSDLEVQYLLTLSGAPNAVGLYLNPPTGFTIDTTRLLSTPSNSASWGSAIARDASTSAFLEMNASLASSTLIGIYSKNNLTIPPTASSSSSQLAETTNLVPITWAASDTITATIKFPVTQFAASTNTLSSTNGNTSWASCGHTTSDFINFGTVTSIESQCKRDGDDLLMRGKFSAGTGAGAEGRLNLKLNGTLLTSAGVSKIPSLQATGFGAFGGTGPTSAYNLMEPSVGYITFSQQNASQAALTKLNGSAYGSGTVVYFSARVPIDAWENSNVIVASLKDTPTTIGSTGSDFQSVTFGSGANCATACTTGTCTICRQTGNKISSVTYNAGAGLILANGIDGTKYGCSGAGYNSTSGYAVGLHNLALSTSSYVYMSYAVANTLVNVGSATINCWGTP